MHRGSIQLLALALGATPSLFGQSIKSINPDSLRLNIKSDVEFKTAGVEGETPSTGTGMLGVSFKQDYFYGSVVFNVLNRNKTLSAEDTTTTSTIFANNLLIPANSGQGVSNFRAELGIKSFAKLKHDWTIEPMFSRHRLGVNTFWQVNKTEWMKDTVTTSLFISSFGVTAAYTLLSAELQNADKANVHITLLAGWEARRLGGDYALNKNEAVREYFLGTKNIAFDATMLGVMLELGVFYGKVQLYNFGQAEQLDGFNGNQSVISLGMNVEFNVAAKTIKPNEQMKKEAIRREEVKMARKNERAANKKEKEKEKAQKKKAKAEN